jgi:3-hydroxybutyryl-CoA dehydrogenase
MTRIAVIGAGTMGAGIAQTAILAGVDATLTDAAADALERAGNRIFGALEQGHARGWWSVRDATAARNRLVLAPSLKAVAPVDAVIEAVPERLELKREVLVEASATCGRGALLATNTSSLLVSAIASGHPQAERIVGMHFFNPVPRMALVEIVPGRATSPTTVAAASALARELGKQVVIARDGIGFLVNRCGRPYIGEALRLLAERIASVEVIDRICRMGGGFRMGPFELADLIGLDVNLAVAESFWRQSYGEARWKPSPLQASLVAEGRLGRKSGGGFYDYTNGEVPRDPPPPPVGGGDGRLITIAGGGPLADSLRERGARAGFAIGTAPDQAAHLHLDADVEEVSGRGQPVHRAVLCARRSLASVSDAHSCGFHLVDARDAQLVELTSLPTTDAEVVRRATGVFAALGLYVQPVGDAPGLVLGRIVAQLVNEASFAIGEGVGSVADVEKGVTLGLNHPRGPRGWSEQMGIRHVRAVLRGLHDERAEERYRIAPLLLHADTLDDRG